MKKIKENIIMNLKEVTKMGGVYGEKVTDKSGLLTYRTGNILPLDINDEWSISKIIKIIEKGGEPESPFYFLGQILDEALSGKVVPLLFQPVIELINKYSFIEIEKGEKYIPIPEAQEGKNIHHFRSIAIKIAIQWVKYKETNNKERRKKIVSNISRMLETLKKEIHKENYSKRIYKNFRKVTGVTGVAITRNIPVGTIGLGKNLYKAFGKNNKYALISRNPIIKYVLGVKVIKLPENDVIAMNMYTMEAIGGDTDGDTLNAIPITKEEYEEIKVEKILPKLNKMVITIDNSSLAIKDSFAEYNKKHSLYDCEIKTTVKEEILKQELVMKNLKLVKDGTAIAGAWYNKFYKFAYNNVNKYCSSTNKKGENNNENDNENKNDNENSGKRVCSNN